MTPPPVGSLPWFIGNLAAAILTYFLVRYWFSRARKEERDGEMKEVEYD